MGYNSGTKTCHKCGMTIPNSAQICPYCGSNVVTIRNKIDNFLFKIAFWIIAIIVIISVILGTIDYFTGA